MSAHASRAGDTSGFRQAILQTLDPDADEQRWYTCQSCGWPCINPIGTLPEQNEECLDCVVDANRQTDLGEWSP